MATEHFFDGNEVVIPGVYFIIQGTKKSSLLSLSAGNTLAINTGAIERGYLGGGSSQGEVTEDVDAQYTFTTLQDFQLFIRGGAFYKLAEPLFKPKEGFNGVSSLTYVNAAVSTAAKIRLKLGGIHVASAPNAAPNSSNTNQSTFDFSALEEGTGANGNYIGVPETRGTATLAFSNTSMTIGNWLVLKMRVNGVDNTIVGMYQIVATDWDGTTNQVLNVVRALAANVTTRDMLNVISQPAISSDGTGSVVFTVAAPVGTGANVYPLTLWINTNATQGGTDRTGDALADPAQVTISSFSGGVTASSTLTRGYAFKVVNDFIDPTKYIIQLWRGTFKGTNSVLLMDPSQASPYDGVLEADCKPELIAKSPPVSTTTEVDEWIRDVSGTGKRLSQFVRLRNSALDNVVANRNILSSDKNNAVAPYYLFGEGTIAGVPQAGAVDFTLATLAATLGSLKSGYDFMLTDRYGTTGADPYNQAILGWAKRLNIKPDVYVAGGSTKEEFDTSVNFAKSFDYQGCTVVHGGCKVPDYTGLKLDSYKSIYTAAAVLGREAGLPPQVPLTFKSIGINGILHSLTDVEIAKGLRAGVLMIHLDGGTFDVIKGVNTLQKNSRIVNLDGTSHSKQFARISRQLIKELVYNAKLLLKDPLGTNQNTLTTEDVRSFVESFLLSKVASKSADNLIVSFSDIVVTRQDDAYNVSFKYTANGEISFIFITGVSLN